METKARSRRPAVDITTTTTTITTTTIATTITTITTITIDTTPIAEPFSADELKHKMPHPTLPLLLVLLLPCTTLCARRWFEE
jgi:hypothetical protein